MLTLFVSADKNYEDAVSKLDIARIEWENRMQEFCKVSNVSFPHDNVLDHSVRLVLRCFRMTQWMSWKLHFTVWTIVLILLYL